MKAIEILKMIDSASMRLDAIKIIEHFQNEAYNQALEDAAKKTDVSILDYLTSKIIKDAILKLKKSVVSTN